MAISNNLKDRDNNSFVEVVGETVARQVHESDFALKRTEVVNSTLTYIGENKDKDALTSDPTWRIKRITVIGGEEIEEYAATGGFDQVWDNRDDGIIFPVPPFENTKSLAFDGVDEYIDLGDNYDFGPATAFSWSIWIKANNFSAQRVFLSKTTKDANVWGYVLYHDSSGKLFLQMRASGTLRSFTFNSTMTAATWYNVVLTYDGGSNINGITAYINAVAETVPGSGTLNDWSNAASLEFGRRSTSFYYSGLMQQVSVWDKELSPAEVTEIYNSGSPADLSLHSATANLQSWWKMNTDATFPTETDNEGAADGTLTNFEVGDYTADVP